MSPEQFLWTWSQELWTQLEQDRSVNYSDRTTLSSGKAEQEITGPRVITQKELNLLTLFLM